ncbi:MAG: peptide chain release factor 3 [Chlamydiae bacterium]|nr:peptide chain release factor 3 [Chlamydiota bacterium]
MTTLQEEIARRRTFAIISHPDAGKTTLTEKLLLYSGMIHTAGMVRGRKGRKMATSDWMAMEQERGISITASAMQFTYKDVVINILDTPGHEDFSEDTYRTLTAADCAIMVIDAAKGVEKQTRKLFEVCRLRKIPILTFVNKMDMPGRDPLDLMDEIENLLNIRCFAYNWPIGKGKEFRGVYDRVHKECLLFTKVGVGGAEPALINKTSLDVLEDADELKEELSLLETAGHPFDMQDFIASNTTPVFFASALTNFGVEPFFDAFIHLAPSPRPRIADGDDKKEVIIDPITTPFSAYVFKIQANMDKRHRDSMAFLRICSGKFEKDLVVKHHRLKRDIRLSRPHSLVSKERTTLDEAYAGDIIGVINPGVFFIGDTISIKGGFNCKPLPQFQPEIFASVIPKDVSKRKSFDKGVKQLTEEGAIQKLTPLAYEGEPIYAAVGNLQFDVMRFRLEDEYGVETLFNLLPYQCSAWIIGNLETFKKPTNATMVKDMHGKTMVLFQSPWEKSYAAKQNPDHQLIDLSADANSD